jgi:hypothetical protein
MSLLSANLFKYESGEEIDVVCISGWIAAAYGNYHGSFNPAWYIRIT